MPKNKKKKYYAIRIGRGVENKIVTTWKECSELVLGCRSIYKGFFSREGAEGFLKGIAEEEIPKILDKNNKASDYVKTKKKSTRSLQGVRVEKELYNKFEKKCEDFNLDIEKAITLLIKEWIE